jgi:REP element-mobilizing transposase RayT
MINPNQISIVHAVAKTVRNLFLLGDGLTNDDVYAHRRDWVFSIMEFQASLMALDVLDFAIMSNHLHFVLRTRPDIVKLLDNKEVARRWLTLCPRSKKKSVVDGQVIYEPRPPRDCDINELSRDKDRIKKLREQLSSVSWWMRLLCQKVAQRANFQDGLSLGHFFKGRFHSTLINDESHLLACSVYVDLNAIKAAMSETLDGYKYTSASVRIQQIRLRHQASLLAQQEEPADKPPSDTKPSDTGGPPGTGESPKQKIRSRRAEFLSPIRIQTQAHVPELHKDGFRCSDKGFLDMTETQYIDLLQWCVRNKITKKGQEKPSVLPECLTKRGIDAELWMCQIRDFEGMYRYEAGLKPESNNNKQSKSNSGGPASGPTDTPL